jgi:deferrochelatase/peroxidase EfeB
VTDPQFPEGSEAVQLPSGPSRRRALGIAGAGVAALGGFGGLGWAARAQVATPGEAGQGAADPVNLPVPFYGPHQAGIATPVQDRLHFTTFDVLTEDRAKLIEMLKAWTVAASRMTAGVDALDPGAFPAIVQAPPGDTGEAVGLPASRLTLTIGFGPSFFAKGKKPRFGLKGHLPEALRPLPHFPGDTLDPLRSGGDIAVQACSDDPQVAVHAIRNLARIGFGTVSVRWSQLGFGKTSSTTPTEQTPRNLFGFKDGTNNIAVDETGKLNDHVWVAASDGPDWLVGGSYLVARRIRMLIEIWDRTSLAEQESIIGRNKREGAPAGKLLERDAVDVNAMRDTSHVRLASPLSNHGKQILRRGYSFVDGSDGLGRLDAGLFFLAYQRDPRTGFIPLQKQLAAHDAMNEYIRHTGSGLWACPPGVTGPGRFWGDTLFT